MKRFGNRPVATHCQWHLWLLVLSLTALSGCGSGSTPRPPYTLVRTLDGDFHTSIALDAANNIYANSYFGSDSAITGSSVTRFVKQSSGQYVSERIGEGPRSTGPIAVSPITGRIFMRAGNVGGQVEVYDNTGKFLTATPFPGNERDLRVSNRGDVFVVSGGIVRLDEDGNRISSFSLGHRYSALSFRIATDQDGNVAVLGAESDSNGDPLPVTLRVYSPEGTLLRETPLNTGAHFDRGFLLKGMTIGADGKLYITRDAGPYRVHVFDYRTGKLLATMTDLLDASQDIAVDGEGNLYILGARHIYIYRPNL